MEFNLGLKFIEDTEGWEDDWDWDAKGISYYIDDYVSIDNFLNDDFKEYIIQSEFLLEHSLDFNNLFRIYINYYRNHSLIDFKKNIPNIKLNFCLNNQIISN